jgi:hypothetical protein
MDPLRFISHIAATRKVTETNERERKGTFEVLAEDIQDTLALERQHTLCEYLTKERTVLTKIYLDRDIYLGEEQPEDALVRKHELEVRNNVDILMGMLQTDNVKPTYVLATRHGIPNPYGKPGSKGRKYKLSFRPFVSGIRIRYTDIAAVIRYVGQEDFWDMSVYKPGEQLLATINGCKGKVQDGYFDARILRPEEEHKDLLDYLAQHVDNDWPFLDLPQDFEVIDEAPQRLVGTAADGAYNREDTEKDAKASPEFVKDLMQCLSASTADDRTTWLKVAMALKSIDVDDDYFEAWLEFSRRCPKKFSIKDCKRTWDSIKETAGKAVTLGTLCFMAAQDNPLAYKEAQRRHWQRSDGSSSCGMDRDANQDGALTGCSSNEIELEKLRLQVRDLMIERWPERFEGRLNRFSMAYQDGKATRILEYQDGMSGVRGSILPDLSVQVVQEGNTVFVGLLNEGFGMRDLNRLHDKIDPNTIYFYSFDDLNRATLRCMDKDTNDRYRVCIMIQKGFTEDTLLSVNVNGKCTHVSARKTDRFMKDLAYEAQRHAAATRGLNLFQTNNFNGPVNTTIVNVNVKQSEFASIRVKLLDRAQEQGLRKLEGFVYERVPGCQCAYRQKCTYGDFINGVLKGDEAYLGNPKRYDEAIKFMENYRVDEMPELIIDKDLISFSNGILQLSTGTFTEYDGMVTDKSDSRVARSHIDKVFDGSKDTPLLDKVLDCQFDKDVAKVLCAMLGRLLFAVNKLDGWQVMPYLVGVGGTGKSLVLAVAEHMFAPGTVAYLAPKREDVFGMANACEKDLVVGRDMPAKLSGSLPQELMQAMTSGDGMEIPRKGTTSLNVTWKAPVIMASNHMPDYVNSGNNVGRRLVTMRFDSVVTDPEEGLLERILDSEMPQIIARCLGEYKDMRALVKATKGGFWKAVPPKLLEWQGLLASATNKLHSFMSMEDDERGCKIERVEGHVTWLLDFRRKFEEVGGFGSYVSDTATFHAFGFRVSDRLENVCKACKQPPAGGRCCASYNKDDRTRKNLIYNMRVVEVVRRA